MRPLLRTLLAAALPVTACGQTMIPSPVPPPQRLPAVTLLPEGSTLNGVMLPRYNAERQLISVLRSKEMRITDSTTIEADAVSVDVYRPDGGRRGRVELGQAIYRQGRETVTASKSVRVTSDDLAATGSGAVFHIPTSRGFLLGPVDCRIYAPAEATTMLRHPPTTRPHTTKAAVLLGALQLPLIAAAPAPLSAKELAAIDHAAAPAAGDLAARQADAEQFAGASAAAASRADQLLASFVEAVGLTGVLAEPAPVTPQPPAPAPARAPQPPAAEPPQVESGPDDTVVQCDGGLFFDGDAGVLVYLDNIRLTNPEFDLNCRDQLKIFLEVEEEKPTAKGAEDAGEAAGNKDPAPAANHPTSPAKPAKQPKPDQLFGGGRFGNLRQIIASGAVRVTRKDAQGRQATATADSAVYDAANGDIILRGGFPTIRQGRDSLVAQEPGLYIRFDKDGNVFAQPGRWKTVAGLRNNKALKPNP